MNITTTNRIPSNYHMHLLFLLPFLLLFNQMNSVIIIFYPSFWGFFKPNDIAFFMNSLSRHKLSTQNVILGCNERIVCLLQHSMLNASPFLLFQYQRGILIHISQRTILQNILKHAQTRLRGTEQKFQRYEQNGRRKSRSSE